MNTKLILLAGLLAFAGSFSSCVTYRKYDDLLQSKQRLDSDYKALLVVKDENKALTDSLSQTKSRLKDTKEELTNIRSQYEGLLKSNTDLLQRYDQLLSQTNNMLSNSSSEKLVLAEQLSQKQRELDAKQRDLDNKEGKLGELSASLKLQEGSLSALREEVNKTKADLLEREKKVQELTQVLAAKDAKLAELKGKVDQALRGFTASELTVREQNGRLYVSLSQNLLFKSGSAKIDPKGVEAIRQVTQVLAGTPDIEVVVEGHTDTDGTPDLNWDLSVSRATAVTKVMTANGLDPKRITASGRGLYMPVASNDTPEGKAQNRRTEIILSPNLDELYKVLKN